MKFKFAVPTTLFFEEECIQNHAEVMATVGKKAMIMTGKHSAKASGALDDVIKALDCYKTEYIIFDEVENNPSVECVFKASEIGKKEKIDYVIGIGGGSPIDAAKGVAVLVAEPDLDVLDLFKNEFKKVLPIVAVPTTAGTGSEVTPYSVLLRKDLQTKVSFGNNKTIPTYAFLDAKYTSTLSKAATISTAVDAFTHVFEGYVANRSTVLSDALALEGMSYFGKTIKALKDFNLTQEDREHLLYVSLLGGMVIAQAGVTIAHGMGYCYTYFKDVPHGKANGFIIQSYLKLLNEVREDKVKEALKVLGYSSVEAFIEELSLLIGKPPVLSEEEIEKYTQLTLLQKGSITNTPYPLDEVALKALWRSTNK